MRTETFLSVLEHAADNASDRELLNRYQASKEEAAFASLVRRHGPMVLRAAKRLVRSEADAEEVFQATFLVLSRKAGSVRDGATLGSWLYRTARRLAQRLRSQNDQRRRREERTETKPDANPAREAAWREVQEILDEEVGRLPSTFQTALLACCFEGLSHEEAALRLGWPMGTVKSRLARGRDLLRTRLEKRGLTLSIAGFTALLTAASAPASVPDSLIHRTLLPASPPTVALASTMLHTALAPRLLTLAAALLLLAWGLAAARPSAVEDPPAAPPAKAPANDLPPGAKARLGTTRLRHLSQVSALAWSPDGKRTYSASRDGVILISDAQTGADLLRFCTNEQQPTIAVSPDGAWLATTDASKSIRIFDAKTGKLHVQLIGHKSLVVSLAFSPDSTRLASGGHNDAIRLWDPVKGEPRGECQRQDRSVFTLAFRPDGKTLASGGFYPVIREWDPQTQKEIRNWKSNDESVVSIAWSPDGKKMATGTYNGKLMLWDAESGKLLRSQDGSRVNGRSLIVTWSPDGKTLATVANEHFLRLWDAATGEIRHEQILSGYPTTNGLAFSPDGKTLACATGQSIRLLDPSTGKSAIAVEGHEQCADRIVFSPDGKTIVSTGYDEYARVWDRATGKQLRQMRVHGPGLALSPDGKLLAVGRNSIGTGMWNIETGKQLSDLSGHKNHCYSLAFSPDGKRLVSGGDDNVLRFFDIPSGKAGRVLKGHDSHVYAVAWSPDGKRVASGGGNNSHNFKGGAQSWEQDFSIRLWDPDSGKLLHLLEGSLSTVRALAFSPVGRLLASAGDDERIRLWDAVRGRLLFTLEGHGYPVLDVAFSPDGNLLASAGGDGTARLWDIATSHEIIRREGHGGTVRGVAFSPDGATLATAGLDTSILLWERGESPLPTEKPSAAVLAAAWESLVKNEKDTYAASRRLLGGREDTVKFLREHLKPLKIPDAEQLTRLIADLESTKFRVRLAARDKLIRLGPTAVPVLRESLQGDRNLDVVRRLEALLQQIEREPMSGGLLRDWRAVRLLERLGGADTSALLQSLASGTPGVLLTDEARAVLARKKPR